MISEDMDESTVRQLLLVRAHDQAIGPLWSAEDAAWATRLASRTVPEGTSPEKFLAERAKHALERLLPRDPEGARWLRRQGRGWLAAGGMTALLGAMLGLATDFMGQRAYVDVLAPVFWGVVCWNVLVFVLLLGAGTRSLLRRQRGRVGRLRQAFAKYLGARLPTQGPAGQAARHWVSVSVTARAVRVAVLLHVASASVALGLIAGMYLRALNHDYRVGWQSTVLDAELVHRLVSPVLTPAFKLSGGAAPDVATLASMRVGPGKTEATVTAKPWIHVFALVLLLFVIGPRVLLAAAGLIRAMWLSRHVAFSLDDDYFRSLLRSRPGAAVQRVLVMPYPAALSAQSALALRARVASEFGHDVALTIAPPTAVGDEEESAAGLTDSRPDLLIVHVELGATPEKETHGRFVAALRKAFPNALLRLVADDSEFVKRFGHLPGRVSERQAAWRQFTDQEGLAFEAAALSSGMR